MEKEKKKSFFKTWHFWTITFLLTILSFLATLSQKGLLPEERIGNLIGSFIIAFVAVSIIYLLIALVQKLYTKIKKG